MRRWAWTMAGLASFALISPALVGCQGSGPAENVTEEEAEDMSMEMSGMYSEEGEELGDEAEPDLGTPGYEEEAGDY